MSDDFTYPTHQDILNAELRARVLRAQSLRAGFVALADALRTLFHLPRHA